MEIENLFRYTALAVGLMEIENLFRSTALAVGLKPSAMQGKARLRGLYRIIYSKTISPRLTRAKPACAGYTGLFIQRPSFRSLCGARDSGSVQPCPICRMSRGAKSPGYGLRSPPARTRADYFFKDHIMPIKIGIRSRNKIP